MKIRVFRSAWNAKYAFRLEPLSLDRVGILEAKLRDVQEELEQTKQSLAEEKAKKVIHLSAASKNVPKLKGSSLEWIIDNEFFTLANEENSICFLVAGWYVISLKVFLAPQLATSCVQLQRNAERIARIPSRAAHRPPLLQSRTAATLRLRTSCLLSSWGLRQMWELN